MVCGRPRFSSPMDPGSEMGSENAPGTHKDRKSAYGACLGGHFWKSGAGRVFLDPVVLVHDFDLILTSGPRGSEKSISGRPFLDRFFLDPCQSCAAF